MLKLKLQNFGHLMQRADSLEKTLMLGKIEDRRRRAWHRIKWLALSTQWTWVWANSRRQWRTGKSSVLFMWLKTVGNDLATEQQHNHSAFPFFLQPQLFFFLPTSPIIISSLVLFPPNPDNYCKKNFLFSKHFSVWSAQSTILPKVSKVSRSLPYSFFLLAMWHSLWDLSSLTRDPGIEAQSAQWRASLVAQQLRTCLQCRKHGSNPWVGKIPWRRAWQPTPVFLPGGSHRQRSLAGYSTWGCKTVKTWLSD